LLVSHRLPAFVCGLTAGDYLLWIWSSSGNHAALALVSGLTLPPLAAVCLCLLALTLVRLIASTARRAPAGALGRATAHDRDLRTRVSHRSSAARRPGGASSPAAAEREESLASTPVASSKPASRTLAA
jgi:hypothetical protein